MNPEIKAKWVAALRSGEYQQGLGYLHSEEGFCCLGVLCDLAAQAGVGKWEPRGRYFTSNFLVPGAGNDYSNPREVEEANIPRAVADWAGLPPGDLPAKLPRLVEFDGNSYSGLESLNDSTFFSFGQIADVIEDQF